MLQVDLNCDMGESFGTYGFGMDEALMKYITSANIACGFHAGDPSTMQKTVSLAVKNGVQIGAHPGFPDLVGFGRRKMDVSPADVYSLVVYQVGALEGFAKAAGGVLRHVKPHGALYNMAAVDDGLADAIAKAVHDVNPKLQLFGLSGSALIRAAKRQGVHVASEVFADRTYQSDGTLSPRNQPGAYVASVQEAVQRVVDMVRTGKVQTQQGDMVNIEAQTVCVHGDGPDALAFVQALHRELPSHGISIQSPDMVD